MENLTQSKILYSNQFFIATNLFYFMEKTKAANENSSFLSNFSNFLFHGLIHKKCFSIFISENNDA